MTTLDRRALLMLTGGLLLNGCRTMADSRDAKLLADAQSLVIRPRWVPGQEADYKTKYIKAVTLLKANDEKTFPTQDPADPDPNSFLSWKKIILLHQMSCQHSNWFLMPWHRLYLIYFESACQLVLDDPTFALPYWDWTLDGSVPKEFYELPVLQEKRDLLPGQQISEELVGPALIAAIMSSSDFFQFHSFPPNPFFMGQATVGRFEGTPHNGVHNTVGGIMGNTTDSPRDPVFWLHHCNIDRLWTQWLALHPEAIAPFIEEPKTPVPPTPGPINSAGNAWGKTLLPLDRKESFPGLMPPQSPALKIKGKTTRSADSVLPVMDLVATEKFGYTYDTMITQTINTAAIAARPKKALKPAVRKKLVDGTNLNGAIVTSGVTIGRELQSEIRNQFTKLATNERAIQASFAALYLPIPSDEDLRKKLLMRFFIIDTNSNFDRKKFFTKDSYKLPEYIGSYTYFKSDGAHRHGGGNPNEVSPAIDITDWLKDQFSKKEMIALTLVAVAVDTKNEYKGINIFDWKSQTELQLQLVYQDLL